MSLQTLSTNQYSMSDDTALGFFDADGGVLLLLDERTSQPSNEPYITARVAYYLGQSASKQDAVEKFAEKFQGKVETLTATVEDPTEIVGVIGEKCFRCSIGTLPGKNFREFLKKNPPKNPGRLRDYYLSEEIHNLLSAQTGGQLSKINQIVAIRLTANKTFQREQKDPAALFSKYCDYIKATPSEKKEGSKIADNIIAQIEGQLANHERALPKMIFSYDYILGAHFGDGSLYVSLSWKPAEGETVPKTLRCIPEWAISGNYKTYCAAFANSIEKGKVVQVDTKQKKFVVTGINDCLENGIPFFDAAPWMPKYKKEQYIRWKASVELLKRQDHFSEQGVDKLLDLTYGLAEKGGRKFTREQLKEWALAWLNKPNRQKRKPRGTLDQ